MIEYLRNNQINDSLKNNHRQYLIGNLSLPQELEYLHDDNVELGITKYAEYKYETPHYHTKATEYQIMLEGCTKYVDLTDNKEYFFEKGDVFVIRPNTEYIQKAPAGAVIAFFKNPGGNDKVVIPMNDKMNKWVMNWNENWY